MKKGDGWFENIFSMDGFKELNIHNCGKRLHNLNHHFGPAIRSFFLIIYVKEGQYVERGEEIMEAGNTGYSSGPHLHFGVWVNGVSVDPLLYIDYSDWE